MSFLPIVQRELRVAARRRSLFRLRWWTTAFAITVSFFCLAIMELSHTRGGAGDMLVLMICWYAAVLCLLSGVFLTADALSSEKREGTLGLLFLSDLRGYDVVLGKFVAVALNAFYCLLALLPAAALSFVLGGVTGNQLWRVALSLANALFFSLALGLCVSACGRDGQRTMGGTLGLVGFLAVGFPLLAMVGLKLLPSPLWTWLAGASPITPLLVALQPNYLRQADRFWFALLGSGLVSCGFLGVAGLILPRAWQGRRGLDRPTPDRSKERSQRSEKSLAEARRQAELRTQNPVSWLARRPMRVQGAAWAVVAAWGLVVIAMLMVDAWGIGSPVVGGYLAMPFGFLLKLLFAVQATRFFREGRQDGALHLLLCTPLTSREIVRGSAKALWRSFLWPLLTFLVLLFAPVAVRMVQAAVKRDLDVTFSAFSGSLLACLFAIRFAVDLLALFWFGMAHSITSRRPGLSPGFTVLFVLVLPSVLSPCWLDMLADIFFIAWGIAKLQRDLRRLLVQEYLPTVEPANFSRTRPPIMAPPMISR